MVTKEALEELIQIHKSSRKVASVLGVGKTTVNTWCKKYGISTQGIVDLTDKTFGRLTVIRKEGSDNNRKALWLCECSCGNTIIVNTERLHNGKTQSCGCYKADILRSRLTTHGMSNSKLYNVWHTMIQRCENPKDKQFKNYGERGIAVCKEWHDSELFMDWALNNGYEEGLTIDRINVNEGYSPSNCRWITQKEQNNNTRRNIIINYNNKTQTLSQWCDELEFKYSLAYNRFKKGKSPEEIFKR